MEITANLVKRLIREQFPQWSRLDVRPVARSGHNNRTFHLGETMGEKLWPNAGTQTGYCWPGSWRMR